VPPTVADQDYGPSSTVAGGVSTYVKTGAARSPPRRPHHPPAHVWQLPLPQPHDDVTVTSSASYGVGSVDSRYYVLDHNLGGSVIPTSDDIQFAQ